MLGVILVCAKRYHFQPLKNSLIKRLRMRVNTVGNTGILLFQLVFVRFHHFSGQNGLLCFFMCIGVFRCLNIVLLVDKIWRDKQCEQLALIQRFFDFFFKILSWRQKFVIPYRNIAVHRIFMDQSHQLVCVMSILFPIAEEDIRIKRFADSLYRFIVKQYRSKIFLQLFLITNCRYILTIRTVILPFTKSLFIKFIDSRFHHQWQHRYQVIFRGCKSIIGVHRAVLLIKQSKCYWHNEKAHLSKVRFKILLRNRLRHICGIINRTILRFEYVFANLIEIQIKIFRVTGEIHPALTIRARTTARPDLHIFCTGIHFIFHDFLLPYALFQCS